MLRRRYLMLALVMVSLSGLVLASDNPSEKSNAKQFNPSRSEARIAADIYYLTTEECEGRGSTTQGIHKAADYIVTRLKEAGLQAAGTDGYFQHFDFTPSRGGPRVGPNNQVALSAGDAKFEVTKTDFQVLGAGNAGSGEAPLVFVGYGLASEDPAYDDYAGFDVAGKVVVMLRNAPRSKNDKEPNFKGKDNLASVSTKVREATKRKAAAILIVNNAAVGEGDPLVRFANFGTRAEKETPPVFHVKRGLIDQALLKAGGKSLADLEKQIDEDFKPASKVLEDVRVSFKADISREPVTFKIKNIIATVPGAGDLENEVVVVGSHYDHVGRGETGSLAGSQDIHFGADDNASGSVCNLEIARRWHELQNGPNASKNRRRVVFQWYAAEEWGLIGARHYCNNPIFPIEKTSSMLNLDMVGRLGFDQFKVGPGQSAEDIKKRPYPLEVMGTTSAKEFPDMVTKANKDLGVNLTMPKSSQFFGASDHYEFWKKQVPVIFFFTGMHPQYHRPTDVFQTINLKGIRQCAELGQNIVEEMATMKRPEFVNVSSTLPRRPARNDKAASKKVEKSETSIRIEKDGGGTPPPTGRRPAGIGIMPGYGDTQGGVLVDGVTEGRPAAKAGIKIGDRIVKINNEDVTDMQGYTDILAKAKPGDKLEVTVDRKGEKVKLTVIFEAPPVRP